MTTRKSQPLAATLLAAGLMFLLWASAALISGLHQVHWQVTTLLREMLVASGLVTPIHTLVEFYTHIKGIEYIICVAFFIAFPLFFQFVEREKSKTAVKVEPADIE